MPLALQAPACIETHVVTVEIDHTTRAASHANLGGWRDGLELDHTPLAGVTHELDFVTVAQCLVPCQADLGLRHRLACVELDGLWRCLPRIGVKLRAAETLRIECEGNLAVEKQGRTPAVVGSGQLDIGRAATRFRQGACTVGGELAHVQRVRPAWSLNRARLACHLG